MTVLPFDPVPVDSLIASLPKADLHCHQEEIARFERIAARRQQRPPYDWRAAAKRLVVETPPGMGRLMGIYASDASLDLDGISADAPEYIIAKIADVLEDGAADGAVLVEIRFGAAGLALLKPDFMVLFREAERKVQAQYPRLCAEAIGFLSLVNDPLQLRTVEPQLQVCLQMARAGLGGVDLSTSPYDTEADPTLWKTVYSWAERAVDAGLGITVHAGEFSTANLAAAFRVPGLRRIGHAVYAASDPRLLDDLARSGATVECSLTCNVILGAVPTYEAHPIRQFVTYGIPVTLNTDLPVHTSTTIGREYAIAAKLGFSPAELLAFTRNAVNASFTSVTRRSVLLEDLQQWQVRLTGS